MAEVCNVGPIISSLGLELDYPGFLVVNDSYNVGPTSHEFVGL